jgi:hypothetical protein
MWGVNQWPLLALNLMAFLTLSAMGQTEIELGGSRSLRPGRYVGFLQAEGRSERIATQVDFFLRSPGKGLERPRLMAIVKLSLGGYNSHEYGSQIYQEIRIHLEAHELTLDEPPNDLSLVLKAGEADGRPSLQGEFWSRTEAVNGIVHLDLAPEEPTHEPAFGRILEGMSTTETPFVPLLQGQYTGFCDGKKSVLQVQTVRALNTSDEAVDFFRYEIVARLGHARNPADEKLPWVQIADFAGGLYSPFRGHLVFSGPSSTSIECFRFNREFKCRYHERNITRECRFHREDSTQGQQGERKFHFRDRPLNPSESQLRNLPQDRGELMSALSGSFSGNLHHEANGKYQPILLRVIPAGPADQSQSANKIYVSTTAIMYFGRNVNEHFVSHRYEPAQFAPGPGFVLSAPRTDSFILVKDWKAGFIRGIWYSRAFGRVGTVELIKENAPNVPVDRPFIPTWQGQFESTRKISVGEIVRWFQLIALNPTTETTDNALPFIGSFQSNVGADKIEPIVRGRLDPYTGALGWSFTKENGLSVISGRVMADGQISIHWPPNPGAFPAWMGNLDFYTFSKVSK